MNVVTAAVSSLTTAVKNITGRILLVITAHLFEKCNLYESKIATTQNYLRNIFDSVFNKITYRHHQSMEIRHSRKFYLSRGLHVELQNS